MTLSIPGLLISRDGTVRRYVGHSDRTGDVLGRAERQGGSWLAVCAHPSCRSAFGGRTQREAIYSLEGHWDRAHREGSADD